MNDMMNFPYFVIVYRNVSMKRSRARVTLGGQCLLLQISLRIKMLIINRPGVAGAVLQSPPSLIDLPIL